MIQFKTVQTIKSFKTNDTKAIEIMKTKRNLMKIMQIIIISNV